VNETRWRPGDPVDWDRPGELWTGGGLHAFVVETTGARTGSTRRAVLGYLEDGPDAWLIIGSKGGAPIGPAWVHNLAAVPTATIVMADGTRVPVRAEPLSGEDEARAWERLADEAPEFLAYRTRTDRHIPIIRLERRSAA
jgi:deazaflavin-dependent oxidoreductase (nitroreductase family)